MTRIDKASKGLVTSIIQYFTVALIQVLLTPYIVKIAGVEVLGSYAFIMQILGLSLLIDLGISTSVTRFLSQSYKDESLSNAFYSYLSVGGALIFVTNCITAMFLILVSLNIDLFIKTDSQEAEIISVCILLLGIWFCIRTPLQVFVYAVTSTQNMSTSNTILITGNILRVIMIILLLNKGYGLLALVIGYLSAELVSYITHALWFRLNYKSNYRFFTNFDFEKLKEVLSIGLKYWGVNMAGILSYGCDALIVAKVLGPQAVGMLYVTKMPALLGTQLIYKISDNAAPAFNEIYAHSNKEHIQKSFCDIVKITLIFALPFSFGVLLFSDTLLLFWVGDDLYAGSFLASCLAITVITQTLNHVFSMSLLSTGKLKNWGKVAISCGVLIIASSFFLVTMFGLDFVLLPLAIVDCFLCFWLLRRIVHLLEFKLIHLFNEAFLGPIKSFSVLVPMLIFIDFNFKQMILVEALVLLSIIFILWLILSLRIGLDGTFRKRLAERFL